MNQIGNDMEWVASRVFSDEHQGPALTAKEMDMKLALEEAYEDEINIARSMLQGNQEFANLPYEKKLKIAANLISEIRSQKEENIKKR